MPDGSSIGKYAPGCQTYATGVMDGEKTSMNVKVKHACTGEISMLDNNSEEFKDLLNKKLIKVMCYA